MDQKKLHKNYNTQPTIQEVFVRNTKNKNINKESKKCKDFKKALGK